MVFEELEQVLRLVDKCQSRPLISVDELTQISYGEKNHPIYSFSLGARSPEAPRLLLFGGVHGLEKIGTQILLSYLETLIHLAEWDQSLGDQLAKIRLLVVPLVNPVGMGLGRRSNGNGIDLMRNAPVDAEDGATFLVGGQRLSKRLPWYRGLASASLEDENQAILDLVESHTAQSKFTLICDLHSGFGLRDRIWFPYACSKRPFENHQHLFEMHKILDQTYPRHIYHLEPQCKHYVTHGDLWDHVYLRHARRCDPFDKILLPLTLEIGSWLWIKKNPRQILGSQGLYNPVLSHRLNRAIRRHSWLIDFLMRLTGSHATWTSRVDYSSQEKQELSAKHWYGGR